MNSEKNKPRVVLDTNIFISALIFGGVPLQVVELCREKKIHLIVSSPILLELARILQVKFDFNKKMALDVLSEIKRVSTVVSPTAKIEIIHKDRDDNKIVECAVEGLAQYIVSGDSHLLDLGHYKNIKILTASSFIKTIPIPT